MKVVIYQDLIDEDRHGYIIKEVPDGEEVYIEKQLALPGLQDCLPMHVTYLRDNEILIIASTSYELSIAKRKSIIKGAIAFYNQHK